MNRRALVQLVFVALFAAGMSGCARKTESFSTVYGGRRGTAASSVNGLSILAEMFAHAGYEVTSRTNAASGIGDAQVIVWAPNRFEPPTEDERELIEAWLAGAPLENYRTFVYIGRDYDAAVAYWQQVAAQANPKDFAGVQRAAALARSAHDTARSAMPAEGDVDWFVARRDQPQMQVKSLSGAWSPGIAADQANILLQGRLEMPAELANETEDNEDNAIKENASGEGNESDVDDYDSEDVYDTIYYDVLLAANDGSNAAADDPFDEEGGFRPASGAPLVSQLTGPWNGQLLVIANGSFLLNLPLVNHEHRKLAGRLIDHCGEPGKVVFWESTSFRATSSEQDNDWSALTVWPLNFILLHLAVLGMLYILWRFPIFGLAYSLRPPATSDFSKHIDALGKLLAATHDEEFARRKLAEYRERVRRETKDAKSVLTGPG